jgi:hypothetical protein
MARQTPYFIFACRDIPPMPSLPPDVNRPSPTLIQTSTEQPRLGGRLDIPKSDVSVGITTNMKIVLDDFCGGNRMLVLSSFDDTNMEKTAFGGWPAANDDIFVYRPKAEVY